MAVQDTPPQTDKDLASIAEARALARAARQAQPLLAEFSQDQIDRLVTTMAEAATAQAEALAHLAVEETGYGVVADKVQKNLFSSRQVLRVHQAHEDRRRGEPHRRPQDRRDCRAVWRRGGSRPIDQPDVHRDL